MIPEKPMPGFMSATLKLTLSGKDIIANAMFQKGKEFFEAAEFIKGKQSENSVYLHLLCQSFEIIIKSLLLFKDYDKYNPILQKKIGHNLLKAYDRYKNDLKINANVKEIQRELIILNSLYNKHFLRYGTSQDIFLDVKSINSKNVFELTKCLVINISKKLK
ncbi:hypothetical protein [Flavobacterium nackdongense]|uniref:HEPN domain-containing protein n=1 Tax=Flavobacterium nackdongense TaxID=2547394 RepID=A0A4P6Y9P4_9FLAO|nr:hypothetical protein [Flavobacterium nackdongense]QBN17315.1 hypothetical protein E1750_00345 [Flavobacterium nackdongense]